MTEHTELPWSIGSNGRSVVKDVPGMSDGCDAYMLAVASSHSLLLPSETKANAAYIVKACNAFPDLVKALTEIDTLATCTGVVDPAQHRNMLDNIYRIARDVLGRVKGAPDHG
jgi:hypothetical protein